MDVKITFILSFVNSSIHAVGFIILLNDQSGRESRHIQNAALVTDSPMEFRYAL